MTLQRQARYDFESLDRMLTQECDPKQVGDELDEIMTDLVYLARDEEDFGKRLQEHHHRLRELRDIFWNLKRSE